MDDRLAGVESTVRELRRSLEAVEARVAALERQERVAAADEPEATPLALPVVDRLDVVTVLSYIGRTFVALGGAYFLRAITDARLVPPIAGIAFGLTYAMFWLIPADRAARAGQHANAAFHQFVLVVIAFPLVWEATVRFAVFTPAWAALMLAFVTAAAFAVPLRRRAQVLAWIATAAALFTSIALIASTGSLIPFTVWLIAFGVATLWLGYTFEWVLLRWPVALLADLVVLALTMRVSNGAWRDPPLPVMAVQLLLLNAYVASIVVRTLVRARNVIAFEVVQTLAALAVGFGGALYVARMTGAGENALAAVNLAAGAGCYAVAFAFIARREGLQRNFYFYTTLGLVLILVSSPMLLSGYALALVWTGLAVGAMAGARATARATLAWHGTAYIVAAAIASGAMRAAMDALVTSAATAWEPFSGTALTVAAVAVACWAAAADIEGDSRTLTAPRLVLAFVAIWLVGGWIVSVAAPPLCGTPGAGAIAGGLATVRTVVLAAAALGVAWLGARTRFHEAAWLLYPVLIAGGLKLFIEDLPKSQPATLFLALAFYGGALILAPRLSHLPPRLAKH